MRPLLHYAIATQFDAPNRSPLHFFILFLFGGMNDLLAHMNYCGLNLGRFILHIYGGG
jgi:hypothetical protein